MHSCNVYPIPYNCDNFYIGERVRGLEMRIKEHKDACKKETREKYVVAEHTWTSQHPMLWIETTVVDQAKRQIEYFLKEVLHIYLTQGFAFNWNTGTGLPDCWIIPYPKTHPCNN